MRRPSILQLLPSAIELGYVALVACVIILVGNGKLILERAGMISSAHLIGQQVSTKVTAGLDSLSRFQFTGTVVDFILWGGIGLIIYSALYAVIRVIRTGEYWRDFDTQEFVHPRQFDRNVYWRQVTINTIVGFILLAVFVVIATLYVIVAIPASFAYARRFILKPGFDTAVDLLMSFIVAFVATTILYFSLKLVIRHHRVTAAVET
jgi:hypothetical protein